MFVAYCLVIFDQIVTTFYVSNNKAEYVRVAI